MVKASQIFDVIDKSKLPQERKKVLFQKLETKLNEQKAQAKASDNRNFFQKTAAVAGQIPSLLKKGLVDIPSDFGGQIYEQQQEAKRTTSKRLGGAIGTAEALGDLTLNVGGGAVNLGGQILTGAVTKGRQLFADDSEERLRAKVDRNRARATIEKYTTFGDPDKPSAKIGKFVGRELTIETLLALATGGIGNVAKSATLPARIAGRTKKVAAASTLATGAELLAQDDPHVAVIAGVLEGLFVPSGVKPVKSAIREGLEDSVVESTATAVRAAEREANRVFTEESRALFDELYGNMKFKSRERTLGVLREVGEETATGARVLAPTRRADRARVAREFLQRQDLSTPEALNRVGYQISRANRYASSADSTLTKNEKALFQEIEKQFQPLAREVTERTEGLKNLTEESIGNELRASVLRLAELSEQLEKKGLLPEELSELDLLQSRIIELQGQARSLSDAPEGVSVPKQGRISNPLDAEDDLLLGAESAYISSEQALGRPLEKQVLPKVENVPALTNRQIEMGLRYNEAGEVVGESGELVEAVADVGQGGGIEASIREGIVNDVMTESKVLGEAGVSETPEITAKKLSSIKRNANFWLNTSSGTIDSLPREIGNWMKTGITNFVATSSRLTAQGFSVLNSRGVKKIPKHIWDSAVKKRYANMKLTEAEEEALKINDELAAMYGREIISRGMKRLDGGDVQLRPDFTPQGYVNYMNLRKRAKEDYIRKVMEMNPGKFKNADEARAYIEEDIISATAEGTIHFSGSIGFRREKPDIELPLDDSVSMYDAWGAYIKSAASHIAKHDAFGFRPVKGKYELTDVERQIKNSTVDKADGDFIRNTILSSIDEGEGIMKKIVNKAKLGQASLSEKSIAGADKVARGSSTLSSLVVGVIKPVIYDVGNIFRTLATHSTGEMFNIVAGRFKAKDKQILKEMRDMGVVGENNTLLVDGIHAGSKFMRYAFKLQSLSQRASAKAQVLASIKQIENLSRKAMKGKLSKKDKSILREEFGYSDEHINLMAQDKLLKEQYMAGLIHNVNITTMAKGAGSIAGKEYLGGGVASALYKFVPYTLLPISQLARAVKRGDYATLVKLSAAYVGMGKFVSKFGEDQDESGRLARFVHLLIDPNKKKLSSEQSIVEDYLYGANIMSGVDFYFRTLFEGDPRLTMGDEWYEVALSNSFGQITSLGINIDQLNKLVFRPLGEYMNPDKEVDVKSMMGAFGATRELYKFGESKEKISLADIKTNKELAELAYNEQMSSNDWNRIPSEKKADVLKNMAIISADMNGLMSDRTDAFFERYTEQRTIDNSKIGKKPYKGDKSTLITGLLERKAEQQGKTKSQYLFDLIGNDPNPTKKFIELQKNKMISDADMEYFQEQGGFNQD